MAQSKLREYIKHVYTLEATVYLQQQLMQKIQYDINSLLNYSGKTLKEGNPKFRSEIIVNTLKYLAYAFITYAVLYGFCWVVSFVSQIIFIAYHGGLEYPNITVFLILMLITFAIIIIISLKITYVSKKCEDLIDDENNIIQMQNSSDIATCRKKAAILRRELDIVNSQYATTRDVLDKYYSVDVIFPKYRNFVAVSSIYEYMSSGRCSELQGHEGAYNKYEDELLQNIIIGKLDEIIRRLDSIEKNQYMLYSAIQDGNNKADKIQHLLANTANSLGRIEDNQEVIKYNTSISAQNSTFLKWLSMYDHMIK